MTSSCRDLALAIDEFDRRVCHLFADWVENRESQLVIVGYKMGSSEAWWCIRLSHVTMADKVSPTLPPGLRYVTNAR